MPKIKLRRGLEKNLPKLDEGEPGFTTDTEKLFVGSKDGNIQFAKQKDLDATNAQVNANTNAINNLSNINTNAEVVDARGAFSKLGDRLADVDSKVNTNTTNIETNTSAIGDLSKLATSDKSSLVNAINSNTASLADNALKAKNRIFKPQFCVSAYWGWTNDYNGSYNQKSWDNMMAQIDIWEKHHVDGVVYPIHIGFNSTNNSFYIAENLDNLAKAISVIQSKGMTVNAIKMHNNFTQAHINAAGDSNYQSAWKGFITQIATKFQPYGIPILTIMNEFGNIYGDPSHFQFVNDCLNLAKSYGYKTGITTMGDEESMNLDPSILNNVDYVLMNVYPYVTNKKSNATVTDSVLGWRVQATNFVIRYMQSLYPNVKFVISESGMQDYYVALTRPSNYTWNASDMVTTNGVAQSLYMAGLLDYFKRDFIEQVWWWYDLADTDATKRMLSHFIGGTSYEYNY